MRKTIDISNLEFATFPQRIAARLIDSIISFLFVLAFVKLAGIEIDFDSINNGSNSADVGLGPWIFFIPLFYLAYEVPTMASRGMTIGKRLMGICVVRTDGLIGIGLDRALIRFCVPMLSGIFPFIGIIIYMSVQLWFFFDPQRQNIADKAARTFVVRMPKGLRQDNVDQKNINQS